MQRHKGKKKEMMRQKKENYQKLKQMFLLRGALLVVSCRAKSNKTVSVRKAPFKTGGGERTGKQQKGYASAYKFHKEGENGPG